MTAKTIAVAVIIVVVVVIIGAVGYKIYTDKQAQYAKECSANIYAMNPLLFNKYYCLNQLIAGVETKLADANNKIASYQSMINRGTLSTDAINRLQAAIECQNNYATYLSGLLNKYCGESIDSIKNSVVEQCGKWYPVDSSVVTDAGSVLPDCSGVLLPGVTTADLHPTIECSLLSA